MLTLLYEIFLGTFRLQSVHTSNMISRSWKCRRCRLLRTLQLAKENLLHQTQSSQKHGDFRILVILFDFFRFT